MSSNPSSDQSSEPSSSRTLKWSLRRQLIVGILTLVAVVLAASGLVIITLTKNYLNNQLENDLVNAAQRIGYGPMPRNGGPGGIGIPGASGDVLLLSLRNGKVLRGPDGEPLNRIIGSSRQDSERLSTDQVAIVTNAKVGTTAKRVNLGGEIGSYLMNAYQGPDDSQLIIGIPTAPVDRSLSAIINLVVASTLIAMVLVGLGSSWLIRRNLAPLDRVARTAREISTLELDTGAVQLQTRVDERDTDPNNEVGQVGLALNGLLDNVEGALTARHESEQRVRQFVADASHELRTPLATIRGYTELSRRKPNHLPETVDSALDRVQSEALRMSSLVDDLLLLARLDEGAVPDQETVDLSRIAIDAVSDIQVIGPEHEWRLELPDEPITITGDPGQIQQVLVNLLANARTHTPAGTTVVTTVVPEPDRVRLTVRDNGPGIPPELLPSVFERFTRADAARNRSGGSTGLGLSIVAAEVSAHDGSVTVHSAPGRTEFVVTFPRNSA
jgi:two-component system OmpR family sensor kinase